MNIASTIQSASLNRHPSPAHDLNPSTAASFKQPVSPTISISSDDNSIPYSTLKPVPRSSNLPPLPDLRFEQSYLASLHDVESWKGVLWVTGRDQVSWKGKPSCYHARNDECGLMSYIGSDLNRLCSPSCRECCGRLVWQAGDIGIEVLNSVGPVWGVVSGGGGGDSTIGRFPARPIKAQFSRGDCVKKKIKKYLTYTWLGNATLDEKYMSSTREHRAKFQELRMSRRCQEHS